MYKKLLFAGSLCTLLFLGGCVSPLEKLTAEARQKNPEAQLQLGLVYFYGLHDQNINYESAFALFNGAAQNGDKTANYFIGLMYYYGLGDVVPSKTIAKRNFDKVKDNLKTMEAAKDLNGIFAYAGMLANGFVEKRDVNYAERLYRYCVTKAFYPGYPMLAEIYLEQLKQGAPNAREYLLSYLNAGNFHNLPQSKYQLYCYYNNFCSYLYSTEKSDLLRESAERGYPPAQYEYAMQLRKHEPNNLKKINDFLERSIAGGYAPAMYEFCQSNTSDMGEVQREILLRKASERNYLPAMLELAEIYLKAGASMANRAYALLLVAEKQAELQKNDVALNHIKSVLSNLDNKDGEILLNRILWQDIDDGSMLNVGNSDIGRIIGAYLSGMREVALRDLSLKYANSIAITSAYYNNDWLKLIANQFPSEAVAELFRNASPAFKNKPGFYVAYGAACAYYGQGPGQAYAATQLMDLALKEPEGEWRNLLLDIAALYKANAYILLKCDNEAYEYLYGNQVLKNRANPELINLLNRFCPQLLKDKKKLAAATGIAENKLGDYRQSEIKPFFDAELNRMTNTIVIPQEPEL